MHQIVLSTQKGGISRLREKGGASAETLYDLQNAYVTTAKTIKQRPGRTSFLTLNQGTVGLESFDGHFYVFASTFIAQSDPRVTCIVLRHPTNGALKLSKIHFAQPFLGRFYVVAEFSNGDIRHYWVTNAAVWAANTIYGYLQKVSPSVPNGFVFEASNTDSTPLWTGGETIVVSNQRQPTTYNGFKFQAITVTGTAPVKTSTLEPTWPTTEGATVIEYSYGGTTPTTTPGSPSPTYPPDVGNGYSPFPPGTDPRPPHEAV